VTVAAKHLFQILLNCAESSLIDSSGLGGRRAQLPAFVLLLQLIENPAVAHVFNGNGTLDWRGVRGSRAPATSTGKLLQYAFTRLRLAAVEAQ
jgi:hypothetical protein